MLCASSLLATPIPLRVMDATLVDNAEALFRILDPTQGNGRLATPAEYKTLNDIANAWVMPNWIKPGDKVAFKVARQDAKVVLGRINREIDAQIKGRKEGVSVQQNGDARVLPEVRANNAKLIRASYNQAIGRGKGKKVAGVAGVIALSGVAAVAGVEAGENIARYVLSSPTLTYFRNAEGASTDDQVDGENQDTEASGNGNGGQVNDASADANGQVNDISAEDCDNDATGNTPTSPGSGPVKRSLTSLD
ncbi:hypothetical protein FRB98_002219 [Tulasnella sp. 332]|nr:hypothetical protein FRB98_002219 [Tulasnella sp. 332]